MCRPACLGSVDSLGNGDSENCEFDLIFQMLNSGGSETLQSEGQFDERKSNSLWSKNA